MREYPHAPVTKGIENSVRQSVVSKCIPHLGMSENVHRAGKPQLGKTLRTKARGFALINESDPVSTGSIGNGRRLTVIQGHLCGPDHQLFEILLTPIVEFHDLDEPGNYEVIQQVPILSPPVPSSLKLSWHNIDDNHTVGQSLYYTPRTPCRIYIYDRTGVSNQESRRVSQAG
jgi:hypothetical protein